MGWWKVQGTEQLLGDRPLDLLGTAISGCVAEYQKAFGRRPTLAEWEAMLAAVMSADDPGYECFEEGRGPIEVSIRRLS